MVADMMALADRKALMDRKALAVQVVPARPDPCRLAPADRCPARAKQVDVGLRTDAPLSFVFAHRFAIRQLPGKPA